MTPLRKNNSSFLLSLVDDFNNENRKTQEWSKTKIRSPIFVKKGEFQYVVELKLPGKKKEDFQIVLKQSILCIRQKSNSDQNEKSQKKVNTKNEFSFFLPKDVCKDAIRARFEKEVLSIIIPKSVNEEKEEIVIPIL